MTLSAAPRITQMPTIPMVDGWYVVPEAKLPESPAARLVYYARLAPSTHNTQPWKFVAGASEIEVFADLERWMPVADPDQRELHISLGCAIESLRIAADFGGWGSEVTYFPVAHDAALVARVRVKFGGPKREDAAGSLLRPMLARHTNRRLFDPARAVSDEDRKRFTNCFAADDVSLHYLQERPALLALAELEDRADALLFARPEYRAELARVIGRGALGASWLLSKLGQLAVGHLPVAQRVEHADGRRLASAPLVALLTTRHDERVDQIHAGEAYLRIALAAEAHGIRVQPMSQTLEVPQTRPELARIFGLGERTAQHLFRLGHAEPEAKPAARRPLESILIAA
jgi:nitroreductase